MKSKLLSAAFLAAFAYSANATVYTVSNVPNSIANFTTINAAIIAATDGDTIYVQPSNTTYGSITLNKSLVMIGSGAWPEGQSGQRSMVSTFSVSATASGSTIKGFDITSSISASGVITGLTVEFNRLGTMFFSGVSSNVVVRNNLFSTTTTGIIGSSSTCTNFLISNNIFRINSTGNVLSFTNAASNGNLFANNIVHSTSTSNPIRGARYFTVIDNIIYGGGSPAATDAIQDCNISHNLFFGNYTLAGVFAVSSNGANNLFGTSFSDVFTEISAINNLWLYAPTAPFTDFNLPVGSPAIGSGTGGNDMGIYAGPSPWMDNPAGAARTYYPGARIPEIYEFVSPGVAAPNSTMQIQIKARNAN